MAPAEITCLVWFFSCLVLTSGHTQLRYYSQEYAQTGVSIHPDNNGLGFSPSKLPYGCEYIRSTHNVRPVVILITGLEVMCDVDTDGGGWLIIQRRVTGTIQFYRGWEEYKYGFGSFYLGEFYLGNQKIHELTNLAEYELRIDMKYNEYDYYARYSSFRLGSEKDGYRIRLGEYRGNAGDSLIEFHDRMKFSTFDMDNDKCGPANCAEYFRGAWWYNECLTAHLNGVWGSKLYGTGLNWMTLTNYTESVTFSEMKIRRIKCVGCL